MVRALHRNSLNPESLIQFTNEKTIGEPQHSLTPVLHTFPYTSSTPFPFLPVFSCKYSCSSPQARSSCTAGYVEVWRARWEVWWEFPWAPVWCQRSRRSHLSKPRAGVPHTYVTDIISIWWLSHKGQLWPQHHSSLREGRFQRWCWR